MTATAKKAAVPDWQVIVGDCRETMAAMPAESVDAIVTDPPYGLGFMGKDWDVGVPGVEFWRGALRVAKPGAHLLAFGGSRTWHRMAVAIEDAGWEIRDSIQWLYATGFPKSLDVAKAIDLAGGLPPKAQAEMLRRRREGAALTREDVARAVGCTPASVRDWEEGRSRTEGGPVEWIVPSPDYRARLSDLLGYSADERRLVAVADDRRDDGTVYGLGHSGDVRDGGNTPAAREWQGWGTALKPAHEPIVVARKPLAGTVAHNVLTYGTGALNIHGCRVAEDPATPGRWPANVILDEHTAEVLDAQAGRSVSRIGKPRTGANGQGWGMTATGAEYDDEGGPSRFFYVAKPTRAERDLGLAGPARTGGELTNRRDGSAGLNNPRAGAGRTSGGRNIHPTVKPVNLMRYLVRLVTPPGGLVLDPFCGSGTTGGAAVLERVRFIGCELSDEYAEIARARIRAWAESDEARQGSLL